ncbi:MAG: ABC transporter permease [Nanoarchaeota archaeon]|nr:ABC transporter permease [Nanoarchaeota archaeon]
MKDFLLLAFNNLKRKKLRSWLTMIGIFIGIAAVVGLISLGQGLQNTISEQFQQLGSDKIIISTKTLGPPGSATSDKLILKEKDLKTIQNVRGVEWAIGFLVKTGQTKFKGETRIGFTMGINPEDLKRLEEVQPFYIEKGRGLKEGDKFKALAGWSHANGDIWKRNIEVGDSMEIEGQEFKIVGILKKQGNPIDDNSFTIPKDTLREIMTVGDEESGILAKAAEGFNAVTVAEDIERKLRKERGEKEEQETFNVQTSEQLLETFTNIFGIVQAVLVGIAAISLIVGGIGIMNTMYTAVLERTKEIGTMKAVGAKNSDVLKIFLFESGLLGLVGGVIGIAIGFSLGKTAELIASNYLGTDLLRADFSPLLIIGALLFSFLIGSLSGLFPALQAARLKPADALRYE